MRPTRGLSGSWLSNMSRERRTALISITVMFLLLVSLVVYQRFTMVSETPLRPPDPEVPADTVTRVEQEAPTASESGTSPVQPASTAGKQLIRPLNGSRQILKSFAEVDEAYGDFRLYGGVAYAASAGEPVLAAGAGTVIQTEEHPLDGGVLVLDHGNGLSTRYAGLGKLLVTRNATIQAGAIIGEVGAPGPARRKLGTHLHVQVLVQGEPVDPVSYFPN